MPDLAAARELVKKEVVIRSQKSVRGNGLPDETDGAQAQGVQEDPWYRCPDPDQGAGPHAVRWILRHGPAFRILNVVGDGTPTRPTAISGNRLAALARSYQLMAPN